MNEYHIPVLLNECIENLNIKSDGIYIDGTLGMGGHSEKIAAQLDKGRLICIDQDQFAVEKASERLKPFRDKITIVKGNFRDLANILDANGVDYADGMLFDLGVSSPQLDDVKRGFSYTKDAPLDMRMDLSSSLTAYDVVNKWSETELRRILFIYGEERYSEKIASSIVEKRKEKPIETTLELVEVIRSAMPSAALREKQHPAKRSFQAIRIAVNNELEALSEMLEVAMERLSPGGRICIISFHSLEDRIVKNAIKKRENGCTCPPEFPVCVCGFKKTVKTITRKPIEPTEEEIKLNPRSRSAKLRVAEKL